jgi:hypothetical protein
MKECKNGEGGAEAQAKQEVGMSHKTSRVGAVAR